MATSKSIENYKINKKFTAWAAPIVEASFGFTSDEDILDFLLDNTVGGFNNSSKPTAPDEPIKPIPETDHYKKQMKEYKKELTEHKKQLKLYNKSLADEVLPLIDKGKQPIGPSGPIASFQTKNGRWESKTKEYKEMKRIIFGQPEIPPEKPITKEVAYNIGKTYNE